MQAQALIEAIQETGIKIERLAEYQGALMEIIDGLKAERFPVHELEKCVAELDATLELLDQRESLQRKSLMANYPSMAREEYDDHEPDDN